MISRLEVERYDAIAFDCYIKERLAAVKWITELPERITEF